MKAFFLLQQDVAADTEALSEVSAVLEIVHRATISGKCTFILKAIVRVLPPSSFFCARLTLRASIKRDNTPLSPDTIEQISLRRHFPFLRELLLFAVIFCIAVRLTSSAMTMQPLCARTYFVFITQIL